MDSRHTETGVRRWRRCLACGQKIKTVESIVAESIEQEVADRPLDDQLRLAVFLIKEVCRKVAEEKRKKLNEG